MNVISETGNYINNRRIQIFVSGSKDINVNRFAKERIIMVLIRPFEERDNTAMLDIEKFCTQGNETLAMSVGELLRPIGRGFLRHRFYA